MPELEIVYKIDGRQKIGNIFYMITCFVDYPFTDWQAMQCPLFFIDTVDIGYCDYDLVTKF